MNANNGIEFDFRALWLLARRHRYWFAGLAPALFGLGLGVCALLPKKYAASLSFIVNTETQGNSNLAQLASLAGDLGLVNSGPSSFMNQIPRVAVSRNFTSGLMDKRYHDSTLALFVLKKRAAIPDADSVEYFFHKAITHIYSIDKEKDVYVVSVEHRDPDFCRFLAGEVYAGIEGKIRENRIANLEERLQFAEGVLVKYKREFYESSDVLKDFLSRNLSLSTPDLLQKKTLLDINVRLAEERYLLASKNYEMTKIERDKANQPLAIIEKAYKPLEHFSPRRSRVVFLFEFLGLGLLALYLAVKHRAVWIRSA